MGKKKLLDDQRREKWSRAKVWSINFGNGLRSHLIWNLKNEESYHIFYIGNSKTQGWGDRLSSTESLNLVTQCVHRLHILLWPSAYIAYIHLYL